MKIEKPCASCHELKARWPRKNPVFCTLRCAAEWALSFFPPSDRWDSKHRAEDDK